jgi:UDP-N-acetylmuramate dehydrogenase
MEIQENVLLGPLTTLKIGGPARYFARVEDETDLWEVAHFAQERNLRLFVLGGGSNLVVADTGFDGFVAHVAPGKSIERSSTPNGELFSVAAGVEWDAFVRHVCEEGLCGVECLAGIPGLVGGSPIQNIGAYGQEVSSTIHMVRALDLQRTWFSDLPRKECGFSYRESIFNSVAKGRYIVTRVDFLLQATAEPNLSYADLGPLRGTGATAMDVYHYVRGVRDRKGMLIDAENPSPDSRSAGSFFKNPVVTRKQFAGIAETVAEPEKIPHWPTETGEVKLAAAWLIEQAGFKKGFALGRVGISSKHTLALINRTGDASCEELLRLRDLIVMTVEDRFRVTLEQEPVMLG